MIDRWPTAEVPDAAILAIKIVLPILFLLMFSSTMVKEAGLAGGKSSR